MEEINKAVGNIEQQQQQQPVYETVSEGAVAPWDCDPVTLELPIESEENSEFNIEAFTNILGETTVERKKQDEEIAKLL